MCSPLKGLLPTIPLRPAKDSQTFWFWLCGVQFDSPVWCTPWSSTLWWDAHSGAWLRGMMHTASFIKIRISLRNRNRIWKYLSLFIKGLDGFESWKKWRSKISWHTPFNDEFRKWFWFRNYTAWRMPTAHLPPLHLKRVTFLDAILMINKTTAEKKRQQKQ